MRTPRPLIAALAAAALLAACGDSKDPQALVASAREYLAKNDHAAAIIQLKNALQADVNSAEARFLLGRALLASGDAAGAAVELRKARELKHPDNEVVPLLARAMLAQGQFKPLNDQFDDVRLDDPKAQADLKVTLANAYVARGLPEQVDAAVKAALAAQPDHPGARVLQARLLAGQRDVDGAMKIVDEVIAQFPQDDGAWKFKADLLLAARNDRDGALDAYRKAAGFNPRNLDAHAGALAILFTRNDAAQVKPQLEQLRKVYPKHPQTQYFDAQLAFLERDFKKARETVLALVKVTPDNVRVLQLAGAVELQAGSPLQAETYLARALQLAPNLPLARRLLTQAYLRSGQADKALETIDPALKAPGADAVTFALAAEAHLLAGNVKEATDYFGRAAKLNPADIRSRSAVALADISRGNVADGFEQLEALAAEDKTGTIADMALISAHLMRREFDAALKAIAGLEKKQPDKPMAHNLRGRVQLAQKNTDAARASFEQALKLDPVYFPAAAALAALDLADKKTDAARARFQGILAKDPKNVPALLALAELSARTGGSKDEVGKLLADAVAAAPDAVRPRLLLIEHHLRNNDTRAATTVAQAGVAAQPNSPELLDALGRVQMAANDHQQALATFNKLASLQPQAAQPHLRVAGVQLAMKNEAAARQSLERALRITPNLVAAQQQLIALDMTAKKPEAALATARTVQKQRPGEAVGFVFEGDIHAAQRNFDAAAMAYRTALAKAPNQSETAVKLHSSLRAANKTAEAERFSAGWMKDHPKDARFLFHLGDLALFQRDYAGAEARYRATLEINPDNAIALNNVAWTMARQGKPGALEYAEKANRLAPNQPVFMDTLGYVLSEAGQHERAIEVQQKAVAAQPDTPMYKLTLANIYIKAGRKADAEKTLNELAALGDKFNGQAEVSRLLKSLKES
ncbi:XrtA/PEP-CTERM system TPR-repeat protein PrsT [Azohydromonas sediminis]|uniref:XrtA/PEP-CTERM system TPR-repeat protein PrsT n=1 Tax=Azohydromonas sediminis TaxID=2259674 RepID=UPI000E64FDA9|nr:XrtA/PEP-CTERM system TPR-repeat protein PrsT [Azohydromonas sediminis]